MTIMLNRRIPPILALVTTLIVGCTPSPAPPDEPYQTTAPESPLRLPELTTELSADLSALALTCIDTEYPNKPGNVVADAAGVRPPKQLHPSFYGCFDWHSSVHGHWALVRQLRLVPDHPAGAAIRARLDEHLAADALAAELAYLHEPHHRTFERPYGWAWLLRLAAELHTWDDPQADLWRANLRPLEDEIVARLIAFLPLQNYPVRVGTHTNTAFALAHALDYARTVGNTDLEQRIVARSREYFLDDRDCPADYEPSGTDFLSPCLEEADLMRRVLPPAEFEPWLAVFLPDPAGPSMAPLREPAVVLDLSDPYLIHLVGLNLSRAWCLAGVASQLPAGHPTRVVYERAAADHATAGMAQVFTDQYGGEHWLATYAVYLLGGTGLPDGS
jgi:hypothetical protein